MRYDAVLGPEEVLPERPFTDPANTGREADVMRAMLAHERARARGWLEDEASTGLVVREGDAEGRRHLIVVPEPGALAGASDVTAVGFFSRPRLDVDHAVLFDLEEELVPRMEHYGEVGLLSYYDVELVKGAYGNLILFATPDVPAEWYEDSVHRRAVEVSPAHYHEVRLHKGSIPGPLLGAGDITIERTKYFDFGGAVRWQGLREFGAAGRSR